MKLTHPHHDLFIPDELDPQPALTRTTHLGIGAHQDDLEFMALHGILECYRKPNQWFGGVICTDGSGSARTGPYANCSDEEMKVIRAKEQRTAATIGQFSFVAQLAHPSSLTKNKSDRNTIADDLFTLLNATRPEFVYTHNPADKHATHIGVFLATLEAIRRMPANTRPKKLLGCEVWRGLDWLPNTSKVVLDVSTHPNLAAALNSVFDSQISGGKRYDLAVEGRRRANATFLDSHAIDSCDQAIYAWDLTPLTTNSAPTPMDFISHAGNSFVNELTSLLNSLD